MAKSFQEYADTPSALLSGGPLLVPLWAVTAISLSESYHLPPIGSSGVRSVVASHDDKITIAGLLVGPERFAWKLALETLAETGRREPLSGLVLVTALTIRTDMQVESLTFSASSAKRDVLEVSIGLVHMPSPNALGKLLDVGAAVLGAAL